LRFKTPGGSGVFFCVDFQHIKTSQQTKQQKKSMNVCWFEKRLYICQTKHKQKRKIKTS
jgi:hypothetical protein